MKKFQRIISFTLCFVLVFFLALTPLRIQASASAAAASALIGVGGTVLSVAAPYIPIFLLLFGIGIEYSDPSELLAAASDLYASAPDSLQAHCLTLGTAIIGGNMGTFSVSSQIADLIESQYGDGVLYGVTHCAVPTNLANLDGVTREDLFVPEVVGSVNVGNDLLAQLNSSFTGSLDYFAYLNDIIDADLAFMQLSLDQQLEKLSDLTYSLDTYLADQTNYLSNIDAALTFSIAGELEAISASSVDIKALLANMERVMAGDGVAQPGDGGNEFEDKKYPLIPPITTGFIIGSSYFKNAQDFFASEDFAAFSAAALIFSKFADIPFFNKLLIISCAIGFIGSLLGMGLDVSSYSVSRRRQTSAQTKARGRMQRSLTS